MCIAWQHFIIISYRKALLMEKVMKKIPDDSQANTQFFKLPFHSLPPPPLVSFKLYALMHAAKKICHLILTIMWDAEKYRPFHE